MGGTLKRKLLLKVSPNTKLKAALHSHAKAKGQSDIQNVTAYVKNLDDLLMIHVLTPKEDSLQAWLVNYIYSHKAVWRLQDLAYLHENTLPRSEISDLCYDFAIEQCQNNNDWISIMDMLTIKKCRLAKTTVDKLMDFPQSRKTLLRMQWFIEAGSPESKLLDQIILSGQEKFKLADWEEIFLESLPVTRLNLLANEMIRQAK